MTPSSNSEARKKAETAERPETVLVEIPVDHAERAIHFLGTIDGLEGYYADTSRLVAARIRDALVARVTEVGS